jgi:hypothetical protein
MNTLAAAILAETKAKRDLCDHHVSFRDYWQTYALMALYVVLFTVFETWWKVHLSAVIYFLAAMVVISRAIHDSQTATNRRFGALVEVLEQKNLL